MSELVQIAAGQPRRVLPPWLRKRVPLGLNREINTLVDDLNLHTVCQSAQCPNQLECWHQGTATFMLMGDHCTRRCGFCAVDKGELLPLDADEPARVAEAIRRLKLKHAVITSVNRDDLFDGGAAHIAATVAAVRTVNPDTTIEILTPDFQGDEAAIAVAADSRPTVFNHNLETVARLHRRVRPAAKYQRSLGLLQFVKNRHPDMHTKTGIMLGLGETIEEVFALAKEARAHDVDMLTVGQYLRPAPENLPVERYVPPEEFAALKAEIDTLGFSMVACAPFVRSSYHAGEDFQHAQPESS